MRPLSLCLALALLVAACGDDADPTASTADSLDGRQFVLQTASGFDPVPDTTVSIRFDAGNVGVDAGCNSIGGPYEIEGSTLVVGDGLSTTEIGCDPERHAQDEALADLLVASPTLTLDADTLVLETASTRLELLDREVASPDRPLAGPAWVLDTIIEGEGASSVPAGGDFTLVVDVPGSVLRVDGPCNGLAAPLDTGPGEFPSSGELQVGELTTTDAGCDEPTAAIEAHVAAVLGDGSVAYEIDERRLTLTRGDLGLGFTTRD